MFLLLPGSWCSALGALHGNKALADSKVVNQVSPKITISVMFAGVWSETKAADTNGGV